MNDKEKRVLDESEQLLRIHAPKLQLNSYERDLSKQYLWREWLKAVATVIAFIDVASTMMWALIQNAQTKVQRAEEDRARRFESAVNRLGSHDANSRLTGITGVDRLSHIERPETSVVRSKAANGGQVKSGQRMWPGT
jgi:hypothetical protein